MNILQYCVCLGLNYFNNVFLEWAVVVLYSLRLRKCVFLKTWWTIQMYKWFCSKLLKRQDAHQWKQICNRARIAQLIDIIHISKVFVLLTFSCTIKWQWIQSDALKSLVLGSQLIFGANMRIGYTSFPYSWYCQIYCPVQGSSWCLISAVRAIRREINASYIWGQCVA